MSGYRSFKEAIVTAGGVNLKEVDPRSMESKIIPGLFLAGDYTNTRYPATLEGAIKSGINAAEQIIIKNSSKEWFFIASGEQSHFTL